MRVCLVDTGPLVSFLDASDSSHKLVVPHLEGISGRLATTSAVITEAMYFVSGVPSGPRLLAEFISAADLDVYDLCGSPEVNESVVLMEKYSDTPMDFADATLVLLAEGLGVQDIFTLDRRGFSAYRTRPGQAFRLSLDI